MTAPKYSVSPNPARFGSPMTLTLQPGSPTDFGKKKDGAVKIVGPGGRSYTFPKPDWKKRSITVDLPPEPPFPGPYQVSVDTAEAQGVQEPVGLNLALCPIYTAQPVPASWGQAVTLSVQAGSPYNFGLSGTVRLVGAGSQSHTFASPQWSATSIRVTLPAQAPFPGPYYFSVDTAQASGCVSALLEISAPLCPLYTIEPAQLAWGEEVTLRKTAASPAHFGDSGTVRLATPSNGASVELPNPAWGRDEVRATLPASRPASLGAAPYFFAVDTAQARNCVSAAVDDILDRDTAIRSALDLLAGELRIEAPAGADPGVPLPARVLRGADPLPSDLTVLGEVIPLAVAITWTVTGTVGEPVRQSRDGADLMFVPRLSEAPSREDLSATLTAAVSLTAAGISVQRQLTVSVQVKGLPVPALLALFNHPEQFVDDLAGVPPCVMVLVPPPDLGPGLPEDLGAILGSLTALGDALEGLSGPFPRIDQVGELAGSRTTADLLLTRLTTLRDKNPSPDENVKGPKLKVLTATPEVMRFLEQHVFYYEWGGVTKYSAEDSFSSAIFVGMPGRAVRLYNAREHRVNEGAFDILVGDGSAVAPKDRGRPLAGVTVRIDSLAGNPPAAVPTTGTAGHFATDTYNDRLSSLKFLPALPWPSRAGELATSDGADIIAYEVDANAVGGGQVEFVLVLGSGVTWKKILKVPGAGDLVAEGAGGSARGSVAAGGLQGQELIFQKAKEFGIMREVRRLRPLEFLDGGQRVTFRWVKD